MPPTAPLILALLAAPAALASWTLPARHRKLLHPPHAAARTRAQMRRWATPAGPAPGAHVFSPLDFGGDPSGATDATAAVAAAVAALLDTCSEPTRARMADWVRDCAGATLDLQGGEFLISAPLAIPPGFGDVHVMGGSLHASAAFPRDRYLIEVGNATVGGGGHNIDVSLSALFLNAGQAAGCIHTENLLGGVLGPQLYAFNFSAFGILASAGFEVTIMQTWAAEFWFDDSRKENGTATGAAVGIYKDGNDGVIDDVVVFSSKIGLWLGGEANQVNAVHTWNLANGRGGTGILATAGSQRLTSCYLDWNDVVFTVPTQISFSGGFFLCGARVRLVAPADGVASGVYIAGNEFVGAYCHFDGYGAVQADGNFTSATDVSVVGTLADSGIFVRGPTATLTQYASAPTSSFLFNFTDKLLFDTASVPIATITASLVLDAPAQAPVAVVARKAEGALVRVDVAAPVTGALTVVVDQSRRRGT
jgi:hypothetical protein